MASTGTRPPLGGPQDLFYAEGTTRGFPRIVRGEGVRVFDDAGRDLIDAASGTFVANLGQANERVLEAMHEQGRRLTFSYVKNTRHDANLGLTERLARLAGPGFERVHLSCDGSEAVEMAVKLLRQRAVALGQPERTRLISLMPSYHGATLGAIALNGDLDAEAVYGPLVQFSEKIPAPLTYRAASPEAAARASADALRETIERVGGERVLALVVEPVGGQSTGANVPHRLFFEEARRLCDAHGIGLVYDEVLCAVRTGSFLASQHEPLPAPDLVALAKGIGAGYAPIGAVLASAALVDDLAGRTGFNLTHTYNANPIACAAGIAVLDEVVERDLTGAATRVGAHLRAGLERLAERSPLVGDVRGRGLLLGLEVVRDRATAEPFGPEVDPADVLRLHGVEHGVLLYARRQNRGRFGDWVVIAPPLVISEDDCDELVERLGRTLDAAAAELHGVILSVATAPAWLVARGVLPAGDHRAEPLGGGVSGEVLRVTAEDGRRVVAKQALARLRVADEWLAPQRRALTEARALRAVRAIAPDAVPAVLDLDEAAFAFSLEHAPDTWRPWQEEIAAGRAHADAGAWAGRVLGAVHAATAAGPALAAGLDDHAAFDALRIDPYFRTAAARRPELAPLLAPCIADLEARRDCLVHGDFAPKNLLLAPAGGGWVLDWEVAHVGDPAFDLGFMLSFLVLCALRWPALADDLRDAADGFLGAYAAAVPAALLPAPQRTWLHAACHVVARVDGKSPALFLDDASRPRAAAAGAALLRTPPATADEAWALLRGVVA